MLDSNMSVLAAVNQVVRGPGSSRVGLPTMAYKQIENSTNENDPIDRREEEMNEVRC
jgi:hypothetical protein